MVWCSLSLCDVAECVCVWKLVTCPGCLPASQQWLLGHTPTPSMSRIRPKWLFTADGWMFLRLCMYNNTESPHANSTARDPVKWLGWVGWVGIINLLPPQLLSLQLRAPLFHLLSIVINLWWRQNGKSVFSQSSRQRHSLDANTASVSRFTPLRCNITLPLKTPLTCSNPHVREVKSWLAEMRWAHVDVGTWEIKHSYTEVLDLASLCNHCWICWTW